jgi:signal transduction histidine kinase
MAGRIEDVVRDDVSILVVSDGTGGPTGVELQAALDPLGHRMIRADTMAEAARLVSRTKFAVIVVAARLAAHGLEIVRRLHALERIPRTPVLLASDVGEERPFDPQADVEVLNLPIDGELMRRRVQMFVALHRQNEEIARLASALAEETKRAAAATAAARTATTSARRAELSIRRKDKMIGILGHDLRNPLSAILLGSGRLIETGSLSPRTKAVDISIHHAAERMRDLVDDILEFARAASTATFPIQPRLTNLQEVVTAIVEEIRQANPSRTITLRARGDLLTECDPDRIAQALGNLVTNAVQHGDGPVAVSVEERQGAISMRVHNRGAPIPRQVRSAIFDPFSSHDHLAPGGLGLGLHIVETIVRAHGGAIVVRSSRSRGTTFEASWPRRREPDRLRPLLLH